MTAAVTPEGWGRSVVTVKLGPGVAPADVAAGTAPDPESLTRG
jgi:hypothetical protein